MSSPKEPNLWWCDACGGLIDGPESGYMEWLSVTSEKVSDYRGFRIIHAAINHQIGHRCSHYYQRVPKGCTLFDGPLEWFVGIRGLVRLVAFIDPGCRHVVDYRGPQVADLREWAEITRRLQLPLYEEARRYFPQAVADGIFGDFNEITIYTPPALQEIIDAYGQEST